jgi:NADH-quinone oxidoreductase subunit M
VNGFDSWTLPLTVALPLLGVGVMSCISRGNERAHKVIATSISFLTLALGVYILARFDYGNSETPQFNVDHLWISALNARFHVFVDGISLPLLALSMLTTALCVTYCAGKLPEPRNPKALLALILLFEAGINGAFIAQDLLLFFVFFEVVLVPMYFLVGIWGEERRQYAALKFFVYTVLGSAFMLLSFLALYFLGGHTFDIPTLAADNSPVRLLAHSTQLLVFGGLFVGFAIKAPLFPFHTWMPDAHTEAPTVASVLLAAVLLKLGAYGFIRIAVPILPEAAVSWGPWVGLLAVIGIVYGALGCLAQRDMKRLIAFSSLAHMGFVMLGISTLTSIGINAAIFAMVAHGLITGMLFFLAGSIQERLGTRDLPKFGGLLAVAPHLTWVLGFCAIASLAMPGLAGFWGEFSAVLASFKPAPGLPLTTFRVYMVLGALGTVLAAGYLLWMYQRVAFGTPSEIVRSREVRDVRRFEWVAWTPLLVLIVVFGVFPGLLFGISDDAVREMVTVFGVRP